MLFRSLVLVLMLALLPTCSEDAAAHLEGSWKLDVKLTRQSREFKELPDEKREAMRGKFKEFPSRIIVDGNKFRLGDKRWTFSVKSDDEGEMILDLTDSEGAKSEMKLRMRNDRLYLVDEERPLAFVRHY